MAYEFDRNYGESGNAVEATSAVSLHESSAGTSINRPTDDEPRLKIAMISSCRLLCECLQYSLRVRVPRIELYFFTNTDEAGDFIDSSRLLTLAILYIGIRRAGDPNVAAEITALSDRISIPVVVMAEGEEIDDIKAAIEAGARGYVSTSMPLNVAVEALQMVRAGGMFIPASCIFSFHRSSPSAAKMTQHASEMIFTARQAAVVRALRQGMANKRIAYELNMCESTVKVHVRNIMRKLNARNRTEVAFRTNELFASEGLTSPPLHGRA